jgi:hypothetical protein
MMQIRIKRNISQYCAFALLGLLFVFPQIQMQIRYLIPIVGLLLLLEPSTMKEKILTVTTLYIFYVCAVGLMIVLMDDDGNLNDATSPIKDLLWISVAVVASRKMPTNASLWLSSIVLIMSLIGLLLDIYAGPAQRWIPFAIQNEVLLDYAGGHEGHVAYDRYGGFTYEAGVIGGMSAIFMLVNLILLLIDRSLQKRLFGMYDRGVALIGIACGVGITMLAKTKSAIAIIILSFALTALTSIIFSKNRVKSIRLGAMAAFITISAVITLTFLARSSPSYNDYIENEYNHIIGAINGENRVELGEGAGLSSRIQGVLLLFNSVISHPLGGGVTLGEYFTNGSRENIIPTPEMLKFWNAGKYNTYYSFILNSISQGGIIAIAYILYILINLFMKFRNAEIINSNYYGILLAVAFLILGFNTELVPYVPMVIFVTFIAEGLEGVKLNRTPI